MKNARSLAFLRTANVEGISRCKQCDTLREEYQENVCICDEETPISQWNTYVDEDDVSKCKVCDIPRQESQENVCECEVNPPHSLTLFTNMSNKQI